MPSRYREDWRGRFRAAVSAAGTDGCQILDIGSGRSPAIPLSERAPDCRYIGLDLSLDELKRAQAGSYDEMIVSDACTYQPDLERRFDVIVSWQVFEHVRSLEAVLDNCRRYLRPGGLLVAQFSGRYSVFAFANRLVPHAIARTALKRLLRRDPQTVFPAFYDRCYYGAIKDLLGDEWSQVAISPWYLGASYFSFAKPIQRLYLAFEDSMVRGRHLNLATHYFVLATRPRDAEVGREETTEVACVMDCIHIGNRAG